MEATYVLHRVLMKILTGVPSIVSRLCEDVDAISLEFLWGSLHAYIACSVNVCGVICLHVIVLNVHLSSSVLSHIVANFSWPWHLFIQPTAPN